MAVVSSCPDDSVLRQLALGRMPPEEVERLARHCEQCPRCIERLHSLKAEDTLTEAMASQGTAPNHSRDAAINTLIERLKRLPSPAASSIEMTTPLAGVPAGESIDSTLAGDISLAPAQAPDEIGRLGGYRILKILGTGGMGVVYHAEDVHLQRPIALKVMKPEVSKNPASKERFLREARAAAKLKSDHVVNIYQVGEERQTVFLAMEFLEGMSLEDWLKKGRKPTLAQAARIGRQIALGLADAHGCGLIHRDIKPANIWLDSRHQGRVKLLDFGLARADKEEQQLTQSGAIIGTPAYMAPEQARGEYVDPRADLFSLGVVLYRLTTGELPFRGDNTMSVLTSLALDTPKSPREINADIPPRMVSLIEQLLAKNREQRPKTAKAVADELAAIEREATQGAADDRTMNIRATSAEPVVHAAPAPKGSKRFRWLAAASLLLLLGGVAAAIVVIIRDRQNNKIAEITVPEGGSAEIKDNGKGKEEAKAPPMTPRGELLPPLQASEPLSPVALVQRPAKLPGVRSWSIETRLGTDGIPMAAYRPDGKRLAVCSQDGSIRIWEPQTSRLVQVLLDEGGLPGRGSLAWSPEGRILAAASGGSKPAIRLWEAETGRPLRTFECAAGYSDALLNWSPDARRVMASRPGECLVWDATDGKLLHKFPLPGVAPLAFSPDGKHLVGKRNKTSHLFLWDVETGKEVRQLGDYPGQLRTLAWSPDGKRLVYGVSGTDVDSVRVLELETGKTLLHRKDFHDCEQVAWSPDGKSFLAFFGGIVRVADLEPGTKAREIGSGFACYAAWSPDGATIARFGEHEDYLYDAATGKQLRTLWKRGTPHMSFGLSMAGLTFAWAQQGETSLASVDTGQNVATLKDVEGPLSWSPDGKRLATTGREHSVILWEDGGKTRRTLTGHKENVSCLVWSPEGKRLASSSTREKRVLLWDADKGEQIRELGPFPTAVEQLAWSPNGRLVACRTSQIGWHFWDVEQHKLVNDPRQWQGGILAFTPDGRTAVRAWSNFLELRDVATGKELRQLFLSAVWSPVWSPSGQVAAIPAASGVELWRGDLGRRLRTLKTGLGIAEVSFSSDGQRVAGRAGERLYVWETDSGRPLGIRVLGKKHNGLTVAADGNYNGNEQVERGIVVVVQKDDGTQEVLEPADFEAKYGWKNDPNKVHLLQPLSPPLYPLPGMPMGPNALVREPAPLPEVNSWTIETLSARHVVRAVAYRPDGKLLATGGQDGTIRIWEPGSGELVRMLSAEAQVYHLSWSRDGSILAANCADGIIRFWDADTGRWRLRIPSYAFSFFWPLDGRTVAVTDPGKMRFFDLATGKLLRSLDFPGYSGPFAWSPDGKRLAFVVQGEKTLRVIDTATGKEIHRLEGHTGPVNCIAWSPDGKRLASGGRFDAGFRLWDAEAGKLLKQVPVENLWENTTNTLAWSPDGRAVLLGFVQGPHGLYDLETGRLLHSPFPGQSVMAVAISPDGKQAVMADSFGVRLYNASTGKLAHVLEKLNTLDSIRSLAWSPHHRHLAVGIGEGVLLNTATGKSELSLPEAWRSAVWSADGKMIAAVGNDGGIRLWDAATYRRVCELEGKDPATTLLAWSADGKRLAAADNRRIWVWSSQTGKLLWQNDKFGALFSLVWSADGRWLAAADNMDKTQAVRIFQGNTGELHMQAPLTWQTQAAWSPDGKTLAAGPSEQGECLLIDAESGKVRVKAPAEGGRHHILSIRWAADGSTFRTLDRGAFQRVFDAVTGKQLRAWPITLPSGEYRWSADGRMVACTTGYEIHLYDENYWPLGILLPGEPFAQLAISADGHYRGNARVERQIRMVVQKKDGTTETLTPHEFESKYKFKNEPDKVRLIEEKP